MADPADAKVVVELRVHGVSGTPPEAMLGCPTEFIEQRAGDGSSGFYRREDWIDTAVEAAAPPRAPGAWRRVMEAYSWGGLTSGRASRALWVLFLPFILINLAHWMLPPAAKQRPAAISVALLRLLALSFTLTLMLATALAVMDVSVWQCVTLDDCAARLGPLSVIASLPRGARTALSAVPLVIAIAVLWLLGREDLRIVWPPPPSGAVMKGDVPLQEPTFWNEDRSTERMRACHVMAWAAGLAAVTLAVPASLGASSSMRAVSLALLAANAVLLAVAVAVTAWNPATARGGRSADEWTPRLQTLRLISLGLLGVSLVWTAAADVKFPSAATQFPGLHRVIYVMLAIQVILMILLLLFIALSRGSKSPAPVGYTPTLGGFTAWFVALIGWLFGGAFSIGVCLLTAQILGTPVISADVANNIIACRAGSSTNDTVCSELQRLVQSGDAPLIVPPPFLGAAVAIAVLIGIAIVVGLFVWRRVTGKIARGLEPTVKHDYPGEEDVEARVSQVAKALAWASLTTQGPKIVAGLTLVAVAQIAALAVWYLSGVAEHLLDAENAVQVRRFLTVVTTAAVVTTSALAAGLVLLAVLAYRNRNLRRLVAVLWDIATFWPRANHPLTPPSYGGHTVYELLVRLDTLHKEKDTRVVFAAHSQGTIIAAATLLHDSGPRKDDQPCQRVVGLLTFGSPLRRLYAQNFPAYFGPKAMQQLRNRRPSAWINLWAHSDPIGGWVCDTSAVYRAAKPDVKPSPEMLAALESVDIRLRDVEGGLKMQPDATYHPICGHSGFWTRGEYDDALEALQSKMLPGTEIDTSSTAPPTAQAM